MVVRKEVYEGARRYWPMHDHHLWTLNWAYIRYPLLNSTETNTPQTSLQTILSSLIPPFSFSFSFNGFHKFQPLRGKLVLQTT